MTGTGNCRSERLCALVRGSRSSGSTPAPPRHFDGESAVFEAISTEKTQSRIKTRRRRSPAHRTSARSAGSLDASALGSKPEKKRAPAVTASCVP